MSTEEAPMGYFDALSTIAVDEKKSSILYNVLPSMVQSRLPRLPSIRRALIDIRSPALALHASRNVSEESLPRTPPPDYTSRAASVAVSQRSLNHDSFDTVEDEDPYEEGAEIPTRSFSTINTPPQFAVAESRTGINWRYANQGKPIQLSTAHPRTSLTLPPGISLSTQAYAESQSHRVDEASLILTRQMYIHSLTYLLRGLPTTLSPEETLSLQAALPPSMTITAPCSHDLSMSLSDPSPPSDPSLLHRIVATIIFETFVLLQFLLPYLKIFLGHAYRFERKHNLAQRVVNSGLMGADAMRRTGLQLTHMVCQMNDGKVGVALSELSFWFVKGVAGGLQQGIRDGVTLMGEEQRTNGRRRGRSGREKNGS